MKIKWLGHAAFQIRAADKRIYVDPYDLRGEHNPADIILLTHDHFEHCDLDSIKKISKRGTHILGSETAAKKIRGCGILRAGDAVHLEGLTIKAVHAYNINKHTHPKGYGIGLIIEHENKRIYHAGDTDLIPEMRHIGKIDVALLPISGLYTMNTEEAVEAAKTINPQIVVPMHYGKVFGSRADADRFKTRIEKETKITPMLLENEPLWI